MTDPNEPVEPTLFDIIDLVTGVWKDSRRDPCPLCGEDRAHPSQHGNHARMGNGKDAPSGCHSYPHPANPGPAVYPKPAYWHAASDGVGAPGESDPIEDA